MDVINVVWTALLSAAALFAIAKVMGHKQMAQMDFFDYITGITIGSIAAELATELELSEFMMMCRQEGYFNLSDIQTAIFEYNGRLTVLPVSDKRPMNPKDVNISPETETICTEVIMDGRILEENLSRMGLNVKWLQKKIEAQEYKEAKEIFLGICDDKKKVTLYVGE